MVEMHLRDDAAQRRAGACSATRGLVAQPRLTRRRVIDFMRHCAMCCR